MREKINCLYFSLYRFRTAILKINVIEKYRYINRKANAFINSIKISNSYLFLIKKRLYAENKANNDINKYIIIFIFFNLSVITFLFSPHYI